MTPRAGGRLGEGVEDDEGVDCAEVADGNHVDARVGEPVGVVLAFVAQRVVLGGDDERGREDVQIIERGAQCAYPYGLWSPAAFPHLQRRGFTAAFAAGRQA